jgi:hypothetical protein
MSQSDKSLALRAWSESVAKNFELFREATEMMVRDHQKSNVKSSSFAIHLHHMSARETSVPIKHSLETLSHRIDAVETERLKVLAQLQALIVNKIGKYQTEIKVQNMNISKRNVQVVSSSQSSRHGRQRRVKRCAVRRPAGDDVLIDFAERPLLTPP